MLSATLEWWCHCERLLLNWSFKTNMTLLLRNCGFHIHHLYFTRTDGFVSKLATHLKSNQTPRRSSGEIWNSSEQNQALNAGLAAESTTVVALESEESVFFHGIQKAGGQAQLVARWAANLWDSGSIPGRAQGRWMFHYRDLWLS